MEAGECAADDLTGRTVSRTSQDPCLLTADLDFVTGRSLPERRFG